MNKNKGITLIALVITVIVLIILTAVTISAITGDEGILSQTKTATRETKIEGAKEQAEIVLSEMFVDFYKQTEIERAGDFIATEMLAQPVTTPNGEFTVTVGEKVNGNYPVTVYEGSVADETKTVATGTLTENGTINNWSESTGGNSSGSTGEKRAPIPEGFYAVGGSIDEGFVISDNKEDEGKGTSYEVAKTLKGNQFVWVPVENFSEFVRHDFGKQGIADANFISTSWTTSKYYEPVGDGVTVDTTASESIQEAQKMYKSVKDNGGFYIGRYEVGKDNSNKVVSKQGATVYNNIKWGNSVTNETGGTVAEARAFDTANNYKVTSTLVYGVQWDAVMRWISKDSTLSKYLKDSTGVGNYSDSDSTNNPAKTGATENYQMKNIYDMAGNVYEWTMEAYNTSYRVM